MRRNGFDYPFTQVSSLLQSGDVTLVNLEAPLISRCQLHLDGMRFCGEGPFAAAMARHGIDVATLENNHIGNYGQEGIMETKKFLKDAGISYATFHEPLYVTVKDITFGIVAVNGVGPRIDTAAFREVIVPVREKADIVIVAVHWGREYSYAPVSAPGIAWDSPREIGHFFIDSGVDLVIGNHPHWVQGVELYHGGFISYAHGNFIFDQEWSRETTEGVVGSYVFENKRLVDVVYTPVVITDYAQPRIVDGEQASRIISAMQNSSRAMVISE
jgi:poly-gamma-glutamate synthesis protein (capsule biosynthesis protein)